MQHNNFIVFKCCPIISVNLSNSESLWKSCNIKPCDSVVSLASSPVPCLRLLTGSYLPSTTSGKC